MISQSLLKGKVKVWLSKKVTEFLGETEESLVEFVTSHLKKQIAPDALIEELEKACVN